MFGCKWSSPTFLWGLWRGKLDRCMRVSNAFNADKSEPLCGIERGCITGFEEGITWTFLQNKHSIEVGFDRGLYGISKAFEGG